MEIVFLGHSSFKITGKDSVVTTDPFKPEMVGLKFPSVEADIVTVSHAHEDHNNISQVRGFKKALTSAGEYEMGGVSVIGIQSFHDDKEGKERGVNIIFVIEIDGLRLAHLGDLGHRLSKEIVSEMGQIDILMIPVGGFYTIDSSVASEIARNIDPKIIIPMHYKMNGMNESLASKLEPVENFVKEMELKTETMSSLKLKQTDLLPEDQKMVVILEKK